MVLQNAKNVNEFEYKINKFSIRTCLAGKARFAPAIHAQAV